MNKLVLVLNSVTEKLVGYLAAALETFLPSFWILLLISLLVGCVFAVIYGRLVNQQKVAGIKNRISANINEAVLYRHDPLLTIKAQGALLLNGLRYLTTAILPIAILTVPSLIIFSAVQTHFGYAPAARLENSELIIRVSKDKSPFNFTVHAEPASAISAPLRVPSTHELIYKVTSTPTALSLNDASGGSVADLTSLLSSNAPAVISSTLLETLVYGSLHDLPSGLDNVSIEKPTREFVALGASFPWYTWSIIFILVGGFAAAKAFRITF